MSAFRLFALLLCFSSVGCRDHPPDPADTKVPLPADGVLLCVWNVENLYDGHDNPGEFQGDDEENWFASDPAARALKIRNLTTALLKMNAGRGPDILALVEVESEAVLGELRDALNAGLLAANVRDADYRHILFKEDRTGRRFAPAIVTRLPVVADRTRKLGRSGNGRILEGHIRVNGRDLTLIVAHWTSRVTDKTGQRRIEYAKDCYGRFRAILTADPHADVIVCGDFNDDPDDESVREWLHASAEAPEVLALSGEPRMLDLCAALRTGRGEGTAYAGRWNVFDHICVSRGLLDDDGWRCDRSSLRVFNPPEMTVGKAKAPLRFGNRNNRNPRGYADHFPVLVRLKPPA